MILAGHRQVLYWAVLWIVALGGSEPAQARTLTENHRSLAAWRALTAGTNPPPQVWVKGDRVRFYFKVADGVEAFEAEWKRLRVPAPDYKVNSALLHWAKTMPEVPELGEDWRQARVIAGPEWQRLSTNLVNRLVPEQPGHAYYYQAFLADGVLYRDQEGARRLAPKGQQPPGLIIDHRFTIEETLDVLAREVERELAVSHPGENLFLMMAPDARRFTQPLLLDRQRRECVWLSPAALFDNNENGSFLTATAENVGTVLFRSHGVALLKNPVSSLFRLGDLGVQTGLRFLRRPLPRTRPSLGPVGLNPGMDLVKWEQWLDQYTGTRRHPGQMKLLIDGYRFFPRFEQALNEATNRAFLNMYIFDRDDVAIGIADQLKARSEDLTVKVVMDCMGTMGAGVLPAGTPLPEDFVVPSGTIRSYLTRDSEVSARWFLNPWLSSDHSKILMLDGRQAWVGGMNIGREYRYEWHDLMVELEGPVVGVLEEEFRKMWAHAGPLGDLSYLVTALSGSGGERAGEGWEDESSQVRLLPTKTGWKPFSTAVMGSLRQAQQYIYVEHPYLFDKRVLIGLVQARKRGVDVRVILPRINDFKGGTRSNLVTANYLLQNGVRVFFYPGMTHVKALLVDDWACLGSANLNHLSLRLCQEQNIASSDPEFTQQLKSDLFDRDFERSYELTEPLSVGWMDFLVDLALESF